MNNPNKHAQFDPMGGGGTGSGRGFGTPPPSSGAGGRGTSTTPMNYRFPNNTTTGSSPGFHQPGPPPPSYAGRGATQPMPPGASPHPSYSSPHHQPQQYASQQPYPHHANQQQHYHQQQQQQYPPPPQQYHPQHQHQQHVPAPAPPPPSPHQMAFLQNQGFPTGLIQAFWQSKHFYPLRVWILDNSQAMMVRDAHIIQPTYQKMDFVTRWDELRDCVLYHAEWYTQFQLPTRFALVNTPQAHPQPPNPPPSLPQYFSLHQSGNAVQEQTMVRQVMHTLKPQGPTPLTAQLQTLYQYIQSMDAGLKARGHVVSIVLTTQGLPTNPQGQTSPAIVQEFVQALRQLETLAVSIVIRICSDDEKTFEFYNALDAQDSSGRNSGGIDVLDDFYGEALEVYLHNPWLCYSLVLHRFRETGMRPLGASSCLDALDERALTVPELLELMRFLFGSAMPFPDPTMDWNGFLRAVEMAMARERPHWNPILQKVTPWINLGLLNAIYTRPPPPPPPQQQPHTHVPQPSSAAAAGGPNSTASQQPQPPSASGSAPATTSQPEATDAGSTTTNNLKEAIEKSWAKEPPNYAQVKDLSQLLGTIQTTFALVEPHDYFSKFHSFSTEALSNHHHNNHNTSNTSNNWDILKRAVRKTRLFLHPDKLPNDLNERQQLLCRTLWDTVSEAWNQKQEQQKQAGNQ